MRRGRPVAGQHTGREFREVRCGRVGGTAGGPGAGRPPGERAARQGAPDHTGLLAGHRPLVEGDPVARVDKGQQELGVGRVPDPAGHEALGTTGIEDPVVPTGGLRAGEEDEVVAGQFGERHLGQPGQR